MSGALCPRRVLKLGGSLLDRPDWPERMSRWLAVQSAADDCLVVGGGRVVDAMRVMDRRETLEAAAVHWLCIAAMTWNARCAALRIGATLSGVEEMLAKASGQRLVVLDAWQFLWEEEPRRTHHTLPSGWDVTSDSIAARAAQVLGANELVLFKSCLPAPSYTLESVSTTGYVDRYFATAAANLPRVRCVDLRSASETVFAEAILTPGESPAI